MRAILLTRDAPVEEDALRAFLLRLTAEPGAGLLRAKGLVAVAGRPGPRVVHAVGHRLHPMGALDAWPFGAAGTRLVLIGAGLDEAGLRRDFAALPGAAAPALPTALAFGG